MHKVKDATSGAGLLCVGSRLGGTEHRGSLDFLAPSRLQRDKRWKTSPESITEISRNTPQKEKIISKPHCPLYYYLFWQIIFFILRLNNIFTPVWMREN
jgi:hypothetical protein